VNTRDTAARVRGVPRCVEIRYRTRTRQTRDLKPAGFPVPVTIPSWLFEQPAGTPKMNGCPGAYARA
jgi:hypothetical protein